MGLTSEERRGRKRKVKKGEGEGLRAMKGGEKEGREGREKREGRERKFGPPSCQMLLPPMSVQLKNTREHLLIAKLLLSFEKSGLLNLMMMLEC